jgi:hypothetical protein
MEGNTLMDEIRQAVLVLLREGKSIQQIHLDLTAIIKELQSSGVYMQAIKEADFAP